MVRKVSAQTRTNLIRKAGDRQRKLQDYDRVVAELARMRVIADALLNHCDKDGGECRVCSEICCPLKDPLHFHHDGCPSCCQAEDAARSAVVKTAPTCSACDEPVIQPDPKFCPHCAVMFGGRFQLKAGDERGS
jgi:hypothetical protein